MKKYDYVLVGSGLYAGVWAYEAKKRGKTCLVVEKRDHIGGNVYCEDVEGIHVHRYGAHIFHTSDRQVWDYVNNLAEFNRYTNSPVANYKGEMYNMTFNMKPGGAGHQPGGNRYLPEAGKGLHREAVGT